MRVSTVERPAKTKALSAVPGMSALEKNLTLHNTVKNHTVTRVYQSNRALLD
jgi:hypothetical protein